MDDRWFPHVTVAAIAVRDGKYLMVEERIQGELVFNQPAGHIEIGETFEQAVKREVLEETGFEFEPNYLVGIYQYIAPSGETYVRFVYYGELGESLSGAELDPVIEQVVWLDRLSLQRHKERMRSQSVLKCVDDFESGKQIPLDIVKRVNV